MRNLEKLCSKLTKENDKSAKSTAKVIDSYFKEVELALNEQLGRKVKVNCNSKNNKGIIEIEFYDKEDLTSLAKAITEIKE